MVVVYLFPPDSHHHSFHSQTKFGDVWTAMRDPLGDAERFAKRQNETGDLVYLGVSSLDDTLNQNKLNTDLNLQ